LRPPLMSNVRPHRSAVTMPRKSLLQRSAWAVRPTAANEPSVPHGRECIESVRSNQRTLFAGRRVRFPLKPMTVERIIICVTGSNRGVNANSSARPCSLVGPAEYRSAWAAGRSGASYRSRRAALCCVAGAAIPSSSTMRPNPSTRTSLFCQTCC
jgi:hypothetical protein